MRQSYSVRLLMLAAALIFPNTYLEAQDKPTVFVHGFNSDGTWFSSMIPPLQAALRIAPHNPDVQWPQQYPSQAANLQSYLQSTGLDSTIIVAHSNGGVVTRRYLTDPSAAYSRVAKVLTVGSPFAGAPLAANAYSGDLSYWLSSVFNSIIEPMWYFAWDPYVPTSITWLSNLVSALGGLFGDVEDLMGLLGFGTAEILSATIGFSPAVLPQMMPGSVELNQMFLGSALAAEAQRAPVRYSLATEHEARGMPFALVGMNAGLVEGIQVGIYAIAWELYDHYSTHPDPELRMLAWRWQLAMQRMSCMTQEYQDLVGTYYEVANDSCSFFFHYANDGIVPWSSSVYPGGGTTEYLSRSIVGNIHHRDQATNGAVLNAVKERLRAVFGVLDRTPTPPGFSVAILGAQTAAYGAQCHFDAQHVSGGTGPFTYQWWIGSAPAGSGSGILATISDPFQLSLVVTDATGATSSAARSVQIDPYAPGCF